MHEWRNWYTRTIEVRMEQSLEVQVLSRAQNIKQPRVPGLFYICYRGWYNIRVSIFNK